MRLPVQAIDSFHRSCLADIDPVWSFMEHKTSEELWSSQSVRILGGFRNSLWLQFIQMSSAWRNHKPEDSNADITTLARLGMIVEITVVVVAHALNVSGEAISIQTPWRPAEAFDPNPYTALSDFHRKVMTSAHPDLPHAWRPLQPSGPAVTASHMWSTPSSGQSGYVMHAVTSGQELKGTFHHTVQTRPNPTYVTKSAAAETINLKRPEATLTFIRPSRRPFLSMGRGSPTSQVRHGTIGCLQDEVVLKQSTHSPASHPKSSKQPAKLKQPPLRRVPLRGWGQPR